MMEERVVGSTADPADPTWPCLSLAQGEAWPGRICWVCTLGLLSLTPPRCDPGLAQVRCSDCDPGSRLMWDGEPPEDIQRGRPPSLSLDLTVECPSERSGVNTICLLSPEEP
ncbi:unnamed protein product [Gadus morhua 'NCC']